MVYQTSLELASSDANECQQLRICENGKKKRMEWITDSIRAVPSPILPHHHCPLLPLLSDLLSSPGPCDFRSCRLLLFFSPWSANALPLRPLWVAPPSLLPATATTNFYRS
ncbi:hypothetical protein FKP32DRAFT_1592954 [Trametes sanguinea]|nr:hypothetical protein FKP32DRAFT_1592954 [Trametes sanguinea]